MKTFNENDIESMEKFYRAKFINSLSGIKSANLVGTIDIEGLTNLSIVSSAVHIGANPALMGIVFRPATVSRHTFENIKETKEFTLNHISSSFFKQAHQTSARYDKDVTEFSEVGLTEEYLAEMKAPFVKESKLKIGLKLREIIHLDINKTEFVIGEICNVHLNEDFISGDGNVDIQGLESMGVTGLDSYHEIENGTRLSYAKPGKEPKEI
jgi:flavin reductase (DIM6/NTAB) family NADH-FMN oxidoreductase RutF